MLSFRQPLTNAARALSSQIPGPGGAAGRDSWNRNKSARYGSRGLGPGTSHRNRNWTAYRPHVTKAEGRIIYVDHLTTAELRQKYASEPSIDAAKIVEVDAVWGAKTLSDAAGVKANYIIASHVIEHVPDLIGWLGELHETLIAQGEVRLVVPDRRFTFDYLRHESTFGQAVAANMLRARAPLIHPILDHFLHFREVNPEQAWNRTLKIRRAPSDDEFQNAVRLANWSLDGIYCDTHCWVFTPKTFAEIFELGSRFGLIDFACSRFYDTVPGSIEFFVHLRKCDDRAEMVRSWQAMRRHALSEPFDAKQRQSLERTRADAASQQVQLDQARAEIAAILNSTSWKVTGPLRALSRLISRRRSSAITIPRTSRQLKNGGAASLSDRVRARREHARRPPPRRCPPHARPLAPTHGARGVLRALRDAQPSATGSGFAGTPRPTATPDEPVVPNQVLVEMPRGEALIARPIQILYLRARPRPAPRHCLDRGRWSNVRKWLGKKFLVALPLSVCLAMTNAALDARATEPTKIAPVGQGNALDQPRSMAAMHSRVRQPLTVSGLNWTQGEHTSSRVMRTLSCPNGA